MALRCTFEGCLYATEQVCARTGNPSPCEYAREEDAPSQPAPEEPTAAPIPASTEDSLRDPQSGVHTGEELGLLEIGPLMEEQYARLITILGDYKAGKTSFLVCLYLACACGMMDDHGLSFAGSLTLPAFEARARAGRKWSQANPPDRMTERTVVGEERGGGFLHLDLVRSASKQRLRLLMSDLPGEWTKDLINHERFGYRLGFLGRSDAVVIMIDGEQLTGPARHVETDRAQILIDRVAALLGDRRPPLQLVATRADKIGEVPPATLTDLANYAATKGFTCGVHSICTFSQDPATACGLGVLELFEACVAPVKGSIESPAGQNQPARLFGWLPVTSGAHAG